MTEQYQPSEADGRSGRGDALLLCLKALAKHYDRPASDTVLTAGLPLEKGALTPDLFVRAAERIGLSAKMGQRRLKDLIPLHVPAILFTGSDGVMVLFGYSPEGMVQVYLPEERRIASLPFGEVERLYSGYCILIKPEYSMSERGESPQLRAQGHWLWSVARQYWRNYTKVIVASAVVNILALASSLFILNVYDRVLPNEAIATLWVLAAGVMLAMSFDFLLRMTRSVIIDHVGRRIDIRVSAALFDRILNAGLQHRPPTTGAFANRVHEYEFVREFFTSSTVTLAIDILFTGLFLLVIYMLAGWIVIVPILGIVLVVAVGLVVQQLIGKQMQAAQEQAALRHSVLVESVGAIETVKSIRGESYLLRKWDQMARSASDTQERIKRLSSFSSSAAMFVQQMITVWIVIGGVYRFSEGDMSMGAIIATVILANRATAPLGQLSMMLTRARHAMSAMQVVSSIMNLPDEAGAATHRVVRTIEAGEIEFRDVEFAYPNSPRKALNGASFRIRPGEKVGIIGRIGSGKTTLGRLMTGLYQPTAGEILIDNVDIRQYHPQEVRSAIALVVQDSDLFFGSVKENLLVANPNAEDADLVRAAKLSGLDQIVTSHPMGFEMPVGENGNNLSGGQRQLVSLARAFISPFKVLFLDEPTSSMDMATERQLIERLKSAIPPDRTFVLCTHRHSALALVDRLMVVEGGRVVADGPKDEVLKALTQQARPSVVTVGKGRPGTGSAREIQPGKV